MATGALTTMDTFDLFDVDDYLEKTGMSKSNRKACLRVIKKLISGEGVTHRSKPGEIFLSGHMLSPKDDIESIRKMASIWLPHRKGPNCLDKGHGWALNHPLQKLVNYKKERLSEV